MKNTDVDKVDTVIFTLNAVLKSLNILKSLQQQTRIKMYIEKSHRILGLNNSAAGRLVHRRENPFCVLEILRSIPGLCREPCVVRCMYKAYSS